jgi:hypothetical protein
MQIWMKSKTPRLSRRMQKGNGNGGGNTRTKVILMLLDKLILALIVAGAGYYFNSLLQQENTRGIYQKQLFDKRVQAYIDILEESKRARDQLSSFYFARGGGDQALGELGRKVQLEDMLSESQELYSDTVRSGRRRPIGYEQVLESLINVESIARENDLYISQEVKDRVDDFLDIVVSDLSKSLEMARLEEMAIESGQTPSSGTNTEEEAFKQSAWKKAEEAYQLLREEIRKSLRIEGILLG